MRNLILFLLLSMLLSGCSSTITQSPKTMETAIIEAGTKIAIEESAKSTVISQITLTQAAIIPTGTPEPTITPTPPAQPIVFNSEKADVFELNKWNGPALAHISYVGDHNFIVDVLDSNGQSTKIMGLVNTIGKYEGWKLLDENGTTSTRLEVSMASGPYRIEIYPIANDYLHKLMVPGTYTNTISDLISLEGETPDLITLKYDGEHNFIVNALDESFNPTTVMGLVNEIGNFEGKKVLPVKSKYIYIEMASGPYTIEVAAKK